MPILQALVLAGVVDQLLGHEEDGGEELLVGHLLGDGVGEAHQAVVDGRLGLVLRVRDVVVEANDLLEHLEHKLGELDLGGVEECDLEPVLGAILVGNRQM